MKTPTPEQLALFDNIQTRPATEEETKALSGLTFYSVYLYQMGEITHLSAFLTEKDANEFIMSHWRQNKSHPDFMRGGEDRARLVVSEHVFDEDGIEDSWAICVFE